MWKRQGQEEGLRQQRKLPMVVGLWIAVLMIIVMNRSLYHPQQSPSVHVPVTSHAGVENKKMVLVSVPALSFLELDGETDGSNPIMQGMPHLYDLRSHSAWGALNIRTSVRGSADVYLSMGAGRLAEGGSGVQIAQRNEHWNGVPVVETYSRFTGRGMSDQREIFVPEVDVLRRLNANNHYHAEPGRLGDAFQAAGVRLSVWGNADKVIAQGELRRVDAAKTYRRYASLMLMDQRGTVPFGQVGGAGLLRDGSRPLGLRTDYHWLLERWKEQPSRSVTLLELGDLQRLYDEMPKYSAEAFKQMRQVILSELDHFIGELAEQTRQVEQAQSVNTEVKRGKVEILEGTNSAELWVFSPQVHGTAAKAKALLAPLLLYSPSGGEGLLTSATTKRQGIVSYVDLAPTLLKAFGIEVPEGMIGLPIHVEPKLGALPELQKQVRQMQQVYALRPTLLYGLAIVEIVIMVAALGAGMFAANRLSKRMRGIGKAWLFSLMLAPVGLLLMGWMPDQPQLVVTAVPLSAVVLVSVACAVYASTQSRMVVCLAGIGLTVGTLLMADGYHGAQAMQHSVLGYDAMIGARYYGMGNECMGVLLGAVLLGLTALQQALRRTWGFRRSVSAVPPGRAAAPAGTVQPAPSAAASLDAAYAAASQLPLPDGVPSVGPRAATGLAAAAWHEPLLGRPVLWPRAMAERGARARAAAWRAAPAAMAGALVAGYLAAPELGANAGGALAAAVGFGALGAHQAGGRRWRHTAPTLALLLAAALAGLWLLNAGAATGDSADRQSHIGRAFETLLQGRLDTIGDIIARKLEMNVHLIAVSAWSKVLLTGLAVMAVLVLRPRGLFRRWRRRYPYLMHGVAANVIGTIAALLLNDSGIVAAATMIIYSSIPLLLLKLEGA